MNIMTMLKSLKLRSFIYPLSALMLFLAGCAVAPDDPQDDGASSAGQDAPAADQASGDAESDLVALNEAQELATRFVTKRAAVSRGRQIKELHVERAKDDPVLYAFNFAEGGFAIVSADKRQFPVLAYSESGGFDIRALQENRLPPGVREWIEHAKELTVDIRSGKIAPLSDRSTFARIQADPDPDPIEGIIVPGGGGPCSGSYHYVKSLNLATTWNQGCGYNDEAPSASDGPCGKAWAGCVAVAMGQVMKYYQFPSGYDWANMANGFGTPATAHLLRDAGARVGMSYSGSGSSASLADVDDALESFGYSTSAQYTDYTFDKVRTEINANRPVIMRGTRDCDFLGFPTCGGHAWVVDGYDYAYYCENGTFPEYIHANWGWGGAYDGWYHDYSLTPGGQNYSYHNNIVIGIKP
ncbi:Putative pyrogenic exotoxin B [Minicystis rosea]|nr:Putative pyrogenic exotoxin B [Minicystis rosea]